MKVLKKNTLGIVMMVFTFLYYAQLCPFIHFHPVDGSGRFRIEVHLHFIDHHDRDYAHQHPCDHPNERKNHFITVSILNKINGSKELDSSFKDFACAFAISTDEPFLSHSSNIISLPLLLPEGFTFTDVSRSPPGIV